MRAEERDDTLSLSLSQLQHIHSLCISYKIYASWLSEVDIAC